MAAVATNVMGSVSRTPHNRLRRNRTAISDIPSPAPIPAIESRIPGRMTPAIVCRTVAPNASRIPISCLRCVMDCEISPYRPIAASNSASAGQNRKQCGQVALASCVAPAQLVDRSEVRDRQLRVRGVHRCPDLSGQIGGGTAGAHHPLRREPGVDQFHEIVAQLRCRRDTRSAPSRGDPRRRSVRCAAARRPDTHDLADLARPSDGGPAVSGEVLVCETLVTITTRPAPGVSLSRKARPSITGMPMVWKRSGWLDVLAHVPFSSPLPPPEIRYSADVRTAA